MIGNGGPPLLAALVCFSTYFANVAMGAAKMGVFLGDIAEMLMLFAAAILFVVGVLAREAARKRSDTQSEGHTSREE